MSSSTYDLTNSSCSIFGDVERKVAIARLATATAALALCFVTGILTVYYKLYTKVIHRLYLYLTCASAVYSATFIGQYLVNYDGPEVYQAPYIAFGFLMQYTGWIVLLFICIITLQLFRMVVLWKIHHTWSRKLEASCILLAILFPLTFCWIPFIHSTYGLSGNWCWIRWVDYRGSSCPVHLEGVIEQVMLWNGPLTVLTILNLGAAIAMLVVLCKRAIGSGRRATYSTFTDRHREILKEALPLLIYPTLFYLTCALETASYVYYILYLYNENSQANAWIFHINAIASPLRSIPIILAFLCPGAIARMKRNQQTSDTYQSLSSSSHHLTPSLKDTTYGTEIHPYRFD